MNHRIRIKKICLECKCPFEVYAYRKNTAKFCSIVCMNKSMLGKHYSISTEFKKGQIAHNYKGLRLSHSGRNVITFKGKVRYAYRYLIEKLLKRKLSSTEHIHHKDNDKENDEILNF